jgi:hypothetical protein
MFTTIDKAIVAFVLGALSIVNWIFDKDWAIGEEGIGIVLAVLMPILVWLFPNKHDARSR